MPTQAEKAQAFRALHDRPGAFIIPNPWDIGSARILAYLGFEALATTSMGYAFSLGRPDNALNRAETLAYASAIGSAASLPVRADLENGFGDDPKVVAKTIRLAAATGLVGGSIEDATGCPDDPIYEIEPAVERIHAATETARAPVSFHPDGARGELLTWPARSRRHHQAAASLSGSGCRRSVCLGVWPARMTSATGVSSVDRPVNVVMGLGRRAIEPGRTFRDRRPPNQCRERPLSHRTGCCLACRAGNARAEYVCFRKRNGAAREVSPIFWAIR